MLLVSGSQPAGPVSQYYQNTPTNWYSYYAHNASFSGVGYAFQFEEPTPAGAQEQSGTIHAQIVRSSADWSSGILTETSIQTAYKETIRNAQHYVYIENQFFITATGEEQAPIHNTIGRAIVEAVVRAAKENRKFRVIVVIPSIPGFAGDLRDNAGSPNKLALTYSEAEITDPFPFNAYYGENDAPEVKEEGYKLELSGLIQNK